MSLLSLESNLIARVGYSSPARFTEKIYIGDIDSNGSIGAGGTILKTDRITMNATAGDVGTPVAGDLWYNATSGKLKYYHGSTVYELADTSSSGIADPGTKVNKDLLQYNGTSWVALGNASGAPLGGPLFMQGITMMGSGRNIIWTTDNASDIGASGATRPRTVYAATSVVINGQTAMKATDSTGGDLSGTYPSTLTVAKVQGYSVASGAPAEGDVLRYDGSTWQHYHEGMRVLASAASSIPANSNSDVLSYAAASGEFDTVKSQFYLLVIIYQSVMSNITVTLRQGAATTVVTNGPQQFNSHLQQMWTRQHEANNTQAFSYISSTGGNGGQTQNIAANWMSSAATYTLNISVANGGTTAYCRSYLIEMRNE